MPNIEVFTKSMQIIHDSMKETNYKLLSFIDFDDTLKVLSDSLIKFASSIREIYISDLNTKSFLNTDYIKTSLRMRPDSHDACKNTFNIMAYANL